MYFEFDGLVFGPAGNENPPKGSQPMMSRVVSAGWCHHAPGWPSHELLTLHLTGWGLHRRVRLSAQSKHIFCTSACAHGHSKNTLRPHAFFVDAALTGCLFAARSFSADFIVSCSWFVDDAFWVGFCCYRQSYSFSFFCLKAGYISIMQDFLNWSSCTALCKSIIFFY